MPTYTAQYLRDVVAGQIAESIKLHRGSRAAGDENYSVPQGDPTEEEITDFLLSNPLLDGELVAQLTDPGLLGFSGSKANASEAWLPDFRTLLSQWASTQEWLAADLVFYHLEDLVADEISPDSEIWTPEHEFPLSGKFLKSSPSHLLLASKLLRQGRLLSELDWREFETLIAELLESQGWSVTLMSGTKDGGIDVLAERVDPTLGQLKAIWQAKKYSPSNKVRLSHLRELSAVVEQFRATKGVIVTTSSLTRGAIDWVRKDTYRLEAKDGSEVEHWVRRRLYET